MVIEELQSDEEFREAYPVMRELRNHLSEEEFLALSGEMVWDGYRLFAGREEGKIVALAGVAVCLNLYYGRHLWVYELVTTANARSRGHGKQMLDKMEELARAERCGLIALSSGVQRADAHRFYEDRMGYNRVSHCFTKELSDS